MDISRHPLPALEPRSGVFPPSARLLAGMPAKELLNSMLIAATLKISFLEASVIFNSVGSHHGKVQNAPCQSFWFAI